MIHALNETDIIQKKINNGCLVLTEISKTQGDCLERIMMPYNYSYDRIYNPHPITSEGS